MRQIFPDIEQVLDIVFSELPDGVYAQDRADNPDYNKRSVSSSELRAHAQMISDLYSNLQLINRDKFVSTVTPAGIPKWEKDLFGTVGDLSLSDLSRQQRLLAKVRAIGGISFPAISQLVHDILDPLALDFLIFPYCGMYNGETFSSWILDYSSLGLDTWLANRAPLEGAGLSPCTPLDCSLNYAAAGLTAQDLLDIQATAYTYEIQIYGNADAGTLDVLDQQLTKYEPARSTHIIRNNSTRPSP